MFPFLHFGPLTGTAFGNETKLWVQNKFHGFPERDRSIHSPAVFMHEMAAFLRFSGRSSLYHIGCFESRSVISFVSSRRGAARLAEDRIHGPG